MYNKLSNISLTFLIITFNLLAYPEESNYPKIMFIGGWTQDPEWEEDRILIDDIEVYDIRRDTWTIETKIPTPRYHSGVALVQGKLYVMGGFHSDQQLFDRATGNAYSLKTLDIYSDM